MRGWDGCRNISEEYGERNGIDVEEGNFGLHGGMEGKNLISYDCRAIATAKNARRKETLVLTSDPKT